MQVLWRVFQPHSRSFCYSDEDLNIMLEDIEICRKLGAAEVVFGVLTNDKKKNWGNAF
ncbi:copper homeostasis protein CutC [Metabacillus idriensis]|uniref:copper homeostasis protein CutC n=1 Tax=Metabacillus idriensis TaxID=324768 RepID=UPI003D819027